MRVRLAGAVHAGDVNSGMGVVRAAAQFLLSTLAMLVGCGRSPAPPPPSAATDPGQPRVVVLSPALAVTMKDLGLARLAVGRHGYDLALDPALPVCGDQAGIDYETLLRARPTHILLQWGARDLPPRLDELAADHGWIVQNFEVLTLNDIRTSAVEMHDLLVGPDLQRTQDRPPGNDPVPAAIEGPPLLAEMERAFRVRGTGFAGAGRVLILTSTSPASAVGPGSFHHQVLEAIGGRPALTAGGPYQELDGEDVIHLAPDAIVLLLPRAPSAAPRNATLTAAEIDALLGPLASLPIPAVRSRRVAIIDDPLCLLPSSSMILVADRLAEILTEWRQPAIR